MRTTIWPFLFGALAVASVTHAEEQPVPKPDVVRASPRTEVAEARRAIAREMAEVAERIQAAADSNHEQRAQDNRKELERLERLDWLFSETDTALQRADELNEGFRRGQDTLDGVSRGVPPIDPPYSLESLDRLRALLASETQREATLEAARRAATGALSDAERARDAAASALERAKQASIEAADESNEAASARELRMAELALRTAEAQSRLRRLELDNVGLGQKQLELSRKLLAAQAAWVRARLELSPEDIEKPIVRIEQDAFNLKNELNSAKLKLVAEERKLSGAQARLERATGPNPELVEEIAAHRLAVSAFQQTVSMLSARIDRLERAKEIWKRRYAVLSATERRGRLLTWQEEAEAALNDLDREQRLESARLAELRTSRATLQSRLSRTESTGGSAVVSWMTEQDNHLKRLIEAYEADLATLRSATQLHRWHLAEIKDKVAQPSFFERLDDIGDSIVSMWQYRLTTIEGNPITAGKLLGAMLLFFLGFVASRYLSRALGHRVLPRFSMNTGARRAVETLTFYFLVVFFGLFALRMVNVPLTIFTVLGGALAIGVGFGSQNIVNNFISGLILLIEQPIKADDLIEVDGTYGTVEQIGPRSTRVRTFANIHIIVPNSSFLEKNVINWTLSDNLVRVEVNVGVAYGSPARKVETLIRRTLEEHPQVEAHPKPIVYFADFGDNALLFEAVFWIRLTQQADRRRIQSDLRFRIDELFRQSDIVIAFPQRDVHLDALRPLEVKVVREEES